jgi:hypothetical protein
MTANSARGDLDHGDVVVDRDRDDSRAVVVSLPPVTAADWYVPQRGKLSSDNPDYPADDRVVCVIFQDTLAESYPYYSGVKPLALSALNERGVQFYAFPVSRLRAVGERDSLDELQRALAPTNVALLRTIVRESPDSIRETARLAERDIKDVHRNLNELARLGLIEFEDDGHAKQPTVWYDRLQVDLDLADDRSAVERLGEALDVDCDDGSP